MRPVNRAESVSEISSSFVKNSMCLYERPGGPVTEISVFEIKISLTGTKYLRFRNIAAKMGISFIIYSKVTRVHKAMTVANNASLYVPPFWLCFLNSSPLTGLNFPI